MSTTGEAIRSIALLTASAQDVAEALRRANGTGLSSPLTELCRRYLVQLPDVQSLEEPPHMQMVRRETKRQQKRAARSRR